MFLVIFGLILSGNVLYIAVLIIEKNKNAFKLSSISVPAIIKPVVILIGIALLMGIVKTS